MGKLSTEAKLSIYEKTEEPTLISNLELWTKIDEKQWDRLERIQGKILKGILRLPSTTPYWGLLTEVGVRPLREVISYQRSMLFQKLMTSEEERLGRIVTVEQKIGGRYTTWHK